MVTEGLWQAEWHTLLLLLLLLLVRQRHSCRVAVLVVLMSG